MLTELTRNNCSMMVESMKIELNVKNDHEYNLIISSWCLFEPFYRNVWLLCEWS